MSLEKYINDLKHMAQ